jgi:hypothetical protein
MIGGSAHQFIGTSKDQETPGNTRKHQEQGAGNREPKKTASFVIAVGVALLPYTQGKKSTETCSCSFQRKT